VSPVGYELGFYIAEDDIRHSHRRENLKPYTADRNIRDTKRRISEDRDIEVVIIAEEYITVESHR
jgi:hypothetical protein